MSVSEPARLLYREALAFHERHQIEAALAKAHEALDLAPDFADARSYIGSTLVQRRGAYEEGLAELERAKLDAPDDAALFYTLGWCYEFVAYRVSKRPQPGLDPALLYAKAEEYLRRCLDLNPQGKLRDDAADLLASIIREDVP